MPTRANVVAALELAKRLGPGATVATIVVGSELRYLSTDVFRTAWLGSLKRTVRRRSVVVVLLCR